MLGSIEYHNSNIIEQSSNSSLPPNQIYDLGSWIRKFLLKPDYQLGETISGNKVCTCIELDYDYEPNNNGSVVFKLTDGDLSIRGIFTEDSMKTWTNSIDSQASNSFHHQFDLSESLILLQQFKLIHVPIPGKTHGDFALEIMNFVSKQNAETRALIQEQLRASQFVCCSDVPEIQGLLKRITMNRAKCIKNYLCLSNNSLKSTFDEFHKTQSTNGIFYIPQEIKARYKLDKPGTYVYGEDLQINTQQSILPASNATKETVPAQVNFDEIIIIDEDASQDAINPKTEELMAKNTANPNNSCFNNSKIINASCTGQTNGVNRSNMSFVKKKSVLNNSKSCPNNIEKDQSLLINDFNNLPMVCDFDLVKANFDVQLVLHRLPRADILEHQNPKKRQNPKTCAPRSHKKKKCEGNMDAISEASTSFKTKDSRINQTMPISPKISVVLNQTGYANHNEIDERNALSVAAVPLLSEIFDPVLRTVLTESQISSPLTDSMEVTPSQEFDLNDFLLTQYPSYKAKDHSTVKPVPRLDKSRKQQQTRKPNAQVVPTAASQLPNLDDNSQQQLIISKPCVSLVPKPSSKFEDAFASFILDMNSKQSARKIFPGRSKENTKPEINRSKTCKNLDIFSQASLKNTRKKVTPATEVVKNSEFISDNSCTPTRNRDSKELVSESTITTVACLPLKQTNGPFLALQTNGLFLDSELEVITETNSISSSISQKLISSITAKKRPIKRYRTRPITRLPKKVTNTSKPVFTQIKPHPKNEHSNIVPTSLNQEGKHCPALKVYPTSNNSSNSAIELEREPSVSNIPLSADTNKCQSPVKKVSSGIDCDEMGLNISTEPKIVGAVSKASVKCTTKEEDTETASLALRVPEIITLEESVEDFITIFDSESNPDFPVLKFNESDSDNSICLTEPSVHQTMTRGALHNMRVGFCPWKIDAEHLMKIWKYSSETRS